MSFTEFDQEEYDRNRRAEGLSEGIAIGEQRGIEIGQQRGIAQGAYNKAIETARTAYAMGLSLAQIVNLTGLSESEIKDLP